MTGMGSKSRRADNFVDDDADQRTEVSATAGERETLVGFLRGDRMNVHAGDRRVTRLKLRTAD